MINNALAHLFVDQLMESQVSQSAPTTIKQEPVKSESTDPTPLQPTFAELNMKIKKVDEQETVSPGELDEIYEEREEEVLGNANVPGEEDPAAESAASPRSKTTTTPAKVKLASGSMNRSMRAQCRILYHRTPLTIPELASRYNRSQEYVKKIIANDAGKNRPDDLDEDYDYVDDETKVKYPPTAPERDEIEGEGEDVDMRLESDADNIPTEEPALPPLSTPSKKPLLKGVMSRADRAQCRILFHRAHIPLTRLAVQYNRSEDYIKRVLTNDAGKKAVDDVDEDYDHVDQETKAKYPPLPQPTKLKRKPSQVSMSEPASRAAKKPRVSNTNTAVQTQTSQSISSASRAPPRSSSSRGTVSVGGDTPLPARGQPARQAKGGDTAQQVQAASLPKPPRVSRAGMSSSEDAHTRVNSTPSLGGEASDSDKFTLLPAFLASLAPPRPHLLAALTHQNFDDAFMRTIYTWPDTQITDLLSALSGDKVINATDAHLIRVHLRQQREESEA